MDGKQNLSTKADHASWYDLTDDEISSLEESLQDSIDSGNNYQSGGNIEAGMVFDTGRDSQLLILSPVYNNGQHDVVMMYSPELDQVFTVRKDKMWLIGYDRGRNTLTKQTDRAGYDFLQTV